MQTMVITKCITSQVTQYNLLLLNHEIYSIRDYLLIVFHINPKSIGQNVSNLPNAALSVLNPP